VTFKAIGTVYHEKPGFLTLLVSLAHVGLLAGFFYYVALAERGAAALSQCDIVKEEGE